MYKDSKGYIDTYINLLKIIACFLVIACHFYDIKNADIITAVMGTAVTAVMGMSVPIFMTISFYLSGEKILYGNAQLLAKRLKRLYYPAFCWTFIMYFVCCIPFKSFTPPPIKNIFFQLLTGHAPALHLSPLWFIFCQMWITVILFIIGKIYKGKAHIAVYALAVLAFIAQYSGLNYNLFQSLIWELKYPLGRLAEMIPYAALGIFIKRFKEKAGNKNEIIFYCALIFLAILTRSLPRPNGFHNSGLFLFFSTGVCTYFFGKDIIKNNAIKNIINYIAPFTLGIYITHIFIGTICGPYISNKLLLCVTIFMICLIGCIALSKLKLKNINKLIM